MAPIAEHLSVEELGRQARTHRSACAARHYQATWVLAQGQTVAEVAAVTGFVSRWLEQLARRYNAFGPDALGDRRSSNGANARLLTPELLDRLRMRLETPPSDGGARNTTPIAAFMAQELGLASVLPAARLGGAAGDRLVDPSAAAQEPGRRRP